MVDLDRGFHVHASEGVQGIVQHLDGQTPHALQGHQRGLGALHVVQHHASQTIGHITHALQIGDGFGDHQDQTQIGCCRLALGNDARNNFV